MIKVFNILKDDDDNDDDKWEAETTPIEISRGGDGADEK